MPNTRNVRWDRNRKEVELLADLQGRGIDPKIKTVVAALRVLGFHTRASCEGHPGGRGLPYPWIQICAQEPAIGQIATHKERALTRRNLREQQRLLHLLALFYQRRKTPYDTRLTTIPRGVFGCFRLQNIGASTLAILPKNKQHLKRVQYQREMQSLATFLKRRWFSGLHM